MAYLYVYHKLAGHEGYTEEIRNSEFSIEDIKSFGVGGGTDGADDGDDYGHGNPGDAV